MYSDSLVKYQLVEFLETKNSIVLIVNDNITYQF